DKAEKIRKQSGAGRVDKVGEVVTFRCPQFQHHDRDDDGKHPITECLQPSGPHRATLPLSIPSSRFERPMSAVLSGRWAPLESLDAPGTISRILQRRRVRG